MNNSDSPNTQEQTTTRIGYATKALRLRMVDLFLPAITVLVYAVAYTFQWARFSYFGVSTEFVSVSLEAGLRAAAGTLLLLSIPAYWVTPFWPLIRKWASSSGEFGNLTKLVVITLSALMITSPAFGVDFVYSLMLGLALFVFFCLCIYLGPLWRYNKHGASLTFAQCLAEDRKDDSPSTPVGELLANLGIEVELFVYSGIFLVFLSGLAGLYSARSQHEFLSIQSDGLVLVATSGDQCIFRHCDRKTGRITGPLHVKMKSDLSDIVLTVVWVDKPTVDCEPVKPGLPGGMLVAPVKVAD